MNVATDAQAAPASWLQVPTGAGERMMALAERLFGLPRSITGNGVRQSLRLLGERIPLEVHEVPSGTRVFDWTIPDEWNVDAAWIADLRGERVVDFANSSLHLLGYSEPVRKRVTRDELLAHVYTRPDRPDAIPYRNAYYDRQWGFCINEHVRQSLVDEYYDVVVDTRLAPGALSYGECYIPGAVADEVLLYAHCCHPALANDNLSGMVVLEALGALLHGRTLRRSYRIVFAPTTIGAIAWLATGAEKRSAIRDGLVLACLGDAGRLTYKRSRHGAASIDRTVEAALAASRELDLRPFSPWGYDERQFCSPGIDLPVGRLTRTPNGEYPEYHTSDDNLGLISAASLEDSLDALCRIVEVFESDVLPLNLSPNGEPQLGRRGLFRKTGGAPELKQREEALLWVLNFADGLHRLSDIALRSGLPYSVIHAAALDLHAADLLRL